MSHDFWLRPDSKDPNSPGVFFGLDRSAPTRLDSKPLRRPTWRERLADVVERASHWLRTFILTGRLR